MLSELDWDSNTDFVQEHALHELSYPHGVVQDSFDIISAASTSLPEKLGLPTAKSMPTAPVGIYGPMPTAKDRP